MPSNKYGTNNAWSKRCANRATFDHASDPGGLVFQVSRTFIGCFSDKSMESNAHRQEWQWSAGFEAL
jgi:hypothetical protein